MKFSTSNSLTVSSGTPSKVCQQGKPTLLKRLLFALLMIGALGVNAQVSSYSFSEATGTYTPITGGTVVATATGASGAASLDDVVYNLPSATIPFTFTFDNVGYTGLNINTNGYITFGATAPGTTGYTPLSATTTYAGAVSAFGRDDNSLFNISGNTGEIRYQTVGIAPNQEFVIQYKNFRPYSSSTLTTPIWRWNYQIRLHQDGSIRLVYDANFVGAPAAGTCQVGLRGPSNAFPTDVKNRLITSGTHTWNTSVPGTSNTSTCAYSTTLLPPSGKTFIFTPPAVGIDVGVTGLVSPLVTGCYGASETVTVTLKNYDATTINFVTNPVTVNASVSGAATYSSSTVVNSGSLAAGASMNVTMPASLNMTATGTYTFNSSSTLASDVNPGNNAMTPVTRTVSAATALPYSESFAVLATPTGWTTTGWSFASTHGNPSNGIYKNLYSSAPSGTFTLLKLGPVTSGTLLNFDYRLVNFSGYPATALPNSPAWGSIVIQVSSDCGATFNTFQTIDPSNHISTTAWASQSYSLSAFAGQSVIIRYVVTWTSGDWYADFDNFNIFTPVANDAGVTAVTANPSSPSLCSGNPVTLTATVKNFGSSTQNAIPVFYTVNGGAAQSGGSTVGPIASSGTENVTITNAFTPATGGTYTIVVYTQLPGDATAGNDATTITYVVGNKITSFPYVEPFTTAPGWTIVTEVVAGTTPIWGLAIATGPDGVAANSGAKANFFNASAGRIERLQSPAMDFTSLTKPVIHYYVSHRKYTGTEDDGLEMVISTDCGASFSTLVPTKYNTSTPSLSTLPGSGTAYVPATASNWRHESIDLGAYAGQSSVIIGFRAISAFGNAMWVDNFIVRDAAAICTDAVSAPGVYSCAGTVSINMASTGNPSGGVLQVNTNSGAPPNTSFVANTTATTQDGSIFTPEVIKTGKWFKVTYTGNDFNGYATYDISIDVTGYTPAGNPNKYYIMKRADQLSSWTALTTTASGNILTASGLTTFSEFAIGGLACITPSTPVVTGPLCAGSTTVSGTTAEANGTTIEVFVNAVSAGTTTVAGNAWTKTVPALTAGNSVTATASTAPGCTSATSSGVTVTGNSTMILSSAPGTDAQSVCINSPITSITYAVGGSATGAQLSSGSFPVGVSASYSSGTYTISGIPSVSGNYGYTITTTGPCGNSSVSGTIIVNPNSTIALSSAPGTNNQTVCSGAAITNITYAIGNGGTGAGATGLPAGVTGSYSGGTFTISGSPTATAGTYNYQVSTTGGCGTATISGSIIINGVLAATFTKTNRSACGPTNDGTITVTPTGGSGSYTYSWTGNTGPGNPAPMNFTAGNVNPLTGLNYGYYNVTVTDNGGCGSISILNIHIEKAYTVVVTNSGSNSSSCGNTGSIILYGNAGVQPYTYSLNGTTYQASNTFTNLAAGNYTGYVKDAAGCVGTKAMTVNAAAPITVSTLVKNASSCANDGSIEVYRSGGISPYTYSLDNVTYVTNNKILNLAAGSYTVYVKDSKGCIGSQAVSVSQGVGVSVTASKTNTSTCVNDGTIQVNAAGGVGPYSYKLNSGSYQPSSSFTGLTNTSYVVTVKDSKGCLGTINVTINLNPIVVTKTSVNASSCASTNGSIQLFRTGGVGPYTYSIDGNTYQVSNSFNGLAPGTYDGYVKDSKTCIGVLSNIVVGPSCGPRQASKNNVEINYEKVKVINSRISAYPNPSSTEFTLMLENASNAKVSINVTDVLGVKVYEASGNRTFKFGKEFKAGMYIVNVIQGTAKQSIKVVKE